MSEVSNNSANHSQASDRVFTALRTARSQLEAIEQARSERIAIVGMAGRFPGADNLEEFWDLLNKGESGIRMLSEAELLAAGIPESTFKQPDYVPAYASFSDPTAFDAAFFNYAPREAKLIDPQQRVFLECAWSALEDAGYDSHQYDGTIGVYGGTALNSYVINLHANPEIRASISPVQAVVNNVMGLMPTRVSYQLDLTGPSCGIQTGCSTALVAIHTACQSLLQHECDMALAGGVTVSKATPEGYVHQPGSIAAPDATCRAFDANGQGTIFGNGVGIVVLKRLRSAILDGDHIYAVIRGSAINNDGADKVNLIAPSVSGQASVIQSALEQAGVNPETISYVEGHGTGTPLGDPIEVTALNKAFSTASNTAFGKANANQISPQIRLGSVKTNLGHLDAAAGAAGLIKTVLALKHQVLPASLNYEQPNPKIDFKSGPFVVNDQRLEWPTQTDTPRRAGVSSFGMGGTNAHAILEEAPERCPSSETNRSWQLIMLSAKTPTALEALSDQLANYLERYPELPLADVAYTLQVGRRALPYKGYCLCQTTADAIKQLRKTNAPTALTSRQSETKNLETSQSESSQSESSQSESSQSDARESTKSIVFMFSGQGSQYIDMAKGFYQTEPAFKDALDRCAEILKPKGIDLFKLVYPSGVYSSPKVKTAVQKESGAATTIQQTAVAQPALFAVEYALAQLWISWGIQPQAMIGHSVGEYVAACLAGVFSLESALGLIAKRSQLMQSCSPGSMLSVLATVEAIKPHLLAPAEIAVINGPQNCVISGPTDVIETVQQQLSEKDIPCRLLATSHAFHSAMMEPALTEFSQALNKVTLSPPTVEIVSNVTGTWLTDSEATSPDYWVNHLRHQVRFSQGLTTLQELSNPVFLEIGPGDTLAKFAAQQLCKTPANTDPNRAHVLYSLPHPRENKADVTTLISALGELWKLGIPIDWSRFYQDSKRHRLSLPTYPFERQSYWVPLVSEQRPGQKIEKNPASPIAQSIQQKRTDIADWFYLPSWKRLPLAASSSDMANHGWLVFSGESFQKSLQSYLSTVSGDDALKSAASADAENAPKIIWVNPGKKFSIGEETDPPTRYTIRPHSATDYQQLIQTLISNQQLPDQVVYGWHLNVTNVATDYINDFKAMVGLTQALAQLKHRLTLSLLTTDAYSVAGRGSTNPSKAKSIGFTQSITQEYPHIGCRILEVESFSYTMEHSGLQQLYQELLTPYHASQRQIAYRGYHRWVQTYEAFPIPKIDRSPGLKQNGTYLIAGDLVEGLGMIYAQALVQNYDAKLILLGRAGLPPVEEWEKWLVTHSPQHSVSQFIRKLQALGQINEQFLWFSGNLAEVSWVEESIEAGVAKFGRISGVFHAGVMGDRASCSIAELTEDECDRICRTKVEGIQTLQQTLAESEIDFYLLQSSLAAVVGGVGFGAYAAANAYLDAFAIEQSKVSPNTTWLSLNWDACTLEGRPEPSQINSTARDHSHSELMSLAMSPDEVWETTQRALASAQPRLTQLVISPRPLANRLKAAFTPSAEQSSTVTASESENSSSINPQANPPEHSRPATVTTEYVAPRTAVEQTVAKEMGELLGIEAVGIYDNFFELGGHSLLAIQAVTKLRKEFPVELPMRAFLFGSPTVAGIAKIIEEQIEENNQEKASQEKDVQSESMQLENVQAEATQANELATLSVENQATIESLLDQIEEMTPEEVKNEV